MTRFYKSTSKIIGDLKSDMDDELENDSCFAGDLEANGINDHSKMIHGI